MSFSSNTSPKKFGKDGIPGRSAWLCGCDKTQSKFVLFCPRCGKGQNLKPGRGNDG